MELEYTVGEAAKAIGVSKNYLYELIRRKNVPYHRFGRTIRIPKSGFVRWLDTTADEHTEWEADL
jgi:excisionase family DNA binding protein